MNSWIRAWVCLGLLGLFSSVALLAGDPPPAGASDQGFGVRQNMRELWRASVGALSAPESPSRLDAMVQQLKAIQVSPKPQTGLPASATQPAGGLRRLLVESTRDLRTRPKGKQLAPEVLEKLKKLPAQGVTSPEELAEALFLTGHFDAAIIFYKQALAGAKQSEDQAWLLYQMANCRRPSDPAAARALYGQILAEHPDSLWSSLAEVQDRLIEWHRINGPRTLLQELNRQSGAKSEQKVKLTSRPKALKTSRMTAPASAPAGGVAGGSVTGGG